MPRGGEPSTGLPRLAERCTQPGGAFHLTPFLVARSRRTLRACDRRWIARAAWLLTPLLLIPTEGEAQQFVTDDAAVVEANACQLEAWAGEAERWIIPACHLVPRVETTVGVIFYDAGTGSRDAHGVLEAKTLLRDADAEPWGLGLVVGGALRTDGGAQPAEAWAYVPVTVNVERAALVWHGNLGWAYARTPGGEDDDHGLMWGMRFDVRVLPRLEVISELFGVAGDGTELQVGLRTEVIWDRLFIDISRATDLSGGDGLGFQLGLAWTPPAFR